MNTPWLDMRCTEPLYHSTPSLERRGKPELKYCASRQGQRHHSAITITGKTHSTWTSLVCSICINNQYNLCCQNQKWQTFHTKHCTFYALTLLRQGSLSEYTIYSFVLPPGKRGHTSQPDLLDQERTLRNIHWLLIGHIYKVHFVHQITYLTVD